MDKNPDTAKARETRIDSDVVDDLQSHFQDLVGDVLDQCDNAKWVNPVMASCSKDKITESLTQVPTPPPGFDPYDIIKVVPRPELPIRVYEGASPPFSQEVLNRSIRWNRDRYHFAPMNPEWLAEISHQRIRDTLQPHLKRLGYESESAKIASLMKGDFQKVYTITASESRDKKKQPKCFVLRILVPADPYFKTESEIATMEIVRYSTVVSVPVIYAYDSSSENALGFEWILMEKINGKPMFDYWKDLDYGSKEKFTKLVAGWNTQLANIVSKKIGAIYMHYTATDLQFYVGRCVDFLFTQENRLSYDIYRGPFKTSADFYASVLAVTAKDVNNLRHNNRTSLVHQRRSGIVDMIWTMRNCIDGGKITAWQEKREKDLDSLSTAIEAFQKQLPTVCERHPVVELPTRLSHHSLSLSNFLIEEDGMRIVLFDWEFSELRPLIHLADQPKFLEGRELSCEPKPNRNSSWARLHSRVEKIKEFEARNKQVYSEEVDSHTTPRLRSYFQAELQKLDSPLQGANRDRISEKLWEPYNHIIFTWQDTKHRVRWVQTRLEPDSGDGFVEVEEECEYQEVEDEDDDGDGGVQEIDEDSNEDEESDAWEMI